MRIVIAAPPKAGNSWLKCLLATIYDLEWLTGAETPSSTGVADFQAWAQDGGFREASIFHHHYDYSDDLCDSVAAVPAHLVTIIRDPYDAIVSLYFFVQTQAAGDDGNGGPRRQAKRTNPIVGKPIDHPDTIEFLESRFRGHLVKASEWVESGRSVVVRYEELHRDPLVELTRATDQIRPVDRERIAKAIEGCRADNMLRTRKGLAKRIRAATVGDWRNHLTEAHLVVFRDKHADLVRRLGYEVR